jgi:hypothetical protein
MVAPGRLRASQESRAIVTNTDGWLPCGGRACVRVIGHRLVPLSVPSLPRKRDARLIARHELLQPSASSLSDLAVLLMAPALPTAKARARLIGELTRQDEPLISTQRVHARLHPLKFVACQHELLEVRAPVDNRRLGLLCCRERERASQRGLHRATSPKCSPHVTDARHVTQLERVADMPWSRERSAAARAIEKLQDGLAVAVLEILPAQQVPVRPKQHLPFRERNSCHLLDGVAPRRRILRGAGALSSSRLPASGRHAGMSSTTPSTPPSQLHPRAATDARAREPSGPQ